MFEDMGMLTIWVSMNAAILMLVMFMYSLGKSSRDGNYQEGMAHEKRVD